MINPKQLQQAMKQLGMKQEEIEAQQVIIKCPDKNIIIENPQVMKVKAMGQESWQITGTEREETTETKITDEDIKMVAEQTGKTEEEAKNALEETNGDIAEAIMKLE